jgi:hypothetical protein
MTVQQFDPENDMAPMPFEDRICWRALEMKKNQLVWRPHVGCFVWDPDEVIRAPSPFPGRIYFILSLARFIDIFGSIDQVAAKLVWLPTPHQAQLIYRQLAGSDSAMGQTYPESDTFSPVEELLSLYGRIIGALRGKNQAMPSQK